MCYWDDGDYFEPGEFDEKIEELKNELRESVKKEINDEIEKLRKALRERKTSATGRYGMQKAKPSKPG